MNQPFTHDVIAPVEGLHLTTDLAIYESVLFGCPPDYQPIPGVTGYFLDAYTALGAAPFVNYSKMLSRQDLFQMDEESLKKIRVLPVAWAAWSDAACIAFPVHLNEEQFPNTDAGGTALLEWLLQLGDQIVDLLRLFLYRPGDDRRIGRVGGLGRGVRGLWLLWRGERKPAIFLARRLSPYVLITDPIRLDLTEFRRWHNTDTFREFSSAACDHPDAHNDPASNLMLYAKVFAAMRSFRENREAQSLEGRFRQLMPLCEDLAKRNDKEKLAGDKLRDRTARVAWFSCRDDWDEELPLRRGHWLSIEELKNEVARLWSNKVHIHFLILAG